MKLGELLPAQYILTEQDQKQEEVFRKYMAKRIHELVVYFLKGLAAGAVIAAIIIAYLLWKGAII